MQDLTEQQYRALTGLARDLTNWEIADEMGLGVNRAAQLVSKVYRKLGVRSRGGAVAVAYERGILRPEYCTCTRKEPDDLPPAGHPDRTDRLGPGTGPPGGSQATPGLPDGGP